MSTAKTSAERDKPSIGTIYSRFLIFSLGSLALIGALGFIPTQRWVGENASLIVVVALVVAWIASLVGTIPIVLARDKSPLDAMPAQFGAMAIRLVAILVIGMSVAWSGWFETKPFLIWLVIGHITMLVTDTHLARSVVLKSTKRETEGALEER